MNWRNLLRAVNLCIFINLTCIFFSDNLFAATGNIPDNEEAIKNIQRRQFETERQLRESMKKKDETDLIERPREETEAITERSEIKFFINDIDIQNSELLSNSEKSKLLQPYLNNGIGYNDINILVRDITNVLIEKGYVTARVKVPLNQNLKYGKLSLVIISGRIEKITPEKDRLRDRMQIFMAFPSRDGDMLNIKDLDQGVEQMNALKSNDVTIKIMPGDDTGLSRVVVYNNHRNWFNIETGIDNLGQKSTGEWREKFTASIDDILSINDNLYANYTSGINNDSSKYSRCYTLNFSFPAGYWRFTTTYSRSEYMQYIQGLSTQFKSSGDSSSEILGVDRIISRYKYSVWKLKSSLSLKENNSYIEDVKVDTSSWKLSVAKFGMDYSDFLFGGYMSCSLDYHRGLSILGAPKDEKDSSSDTPRVQFSKYELAMSWNRMFSIFGQSFGYQLNFTGQYATETLYSTEKISIGDFYSVRGFKDNSVSGDRGFYLRNELSVFDFSRIWSKFRGLKIFLGYDQGYITEKTGREANNGRGRAYLSGYSSGLNYVLGGLNMNLTYSRKIKSPDFIEEKGHVVYFMATLNVSDVFSAIWSSDSDNKSKKE